MKKVLGGLVVSTISLVFCAPQVKAENYRLTDAQLEQVTAAGGQITSIGPAKTKARAVVQRGAKRRGGQIASI